jgi:hypothetical protein
VLGNKAVVCRDQKIQHVYRAFLQPPGATKNANAKRVPHPAKPPEAKFNSRGIQKQGFRLHSHAAQRLLQRIKHLRGMPRAKRQRWTQPAAYFPAHAHIHAVAQCLARQRSASVETGAVECEERAWVTLLQKDGGGRGMLPSTATANVGYERRVLGAELLQTRIQNSAGFLRALAKVMLLGCVDDRGQLD